MSRQHANITEQQVCDFLMQNPDFLLQHPYVLLNLDLHGQTQGLPNLALHQQRLLREKNSHLKQKIIDVSSLAVENERIFKLFSDCQRQLWCCNNFNELANTLSKTLSKTPNIGYCKLYQFTPKLDTLRQQRLSDTGYYLGRLTDDEKLYFCQDKNAYQAQSFALFSIGKIEEPLAILVFASSSGDHFNPSNDNLFLNEFILSLECRLMALA